ncbi:GGDEF domain-containing protein [Sphingomicrobium astaxanthinifaciens]|uniref:GGDEF domain-containing protein n=1 Tax=Sphingomicrobium astaxanthinifaciens TaxID=1227949 RepID=UPI001FCA985D|nr:diguanylate cyclase [Sphingomicrobium astaxanthinifaciens]MCJ7420428.1 diguanylate cyclase [Sphingomicrobium astaxanthinifaciens]
MLKSSKFSALLHPRQIGFFVAFFVVTALTIFTTRYGGGLALVWLGTGLIAANLRNLPFKKWWPIVLSFGILSAIATTIFGFGLKGAFPLAVLNLAEAALIATLLRVHRPQGDYLESIPGFLSMLVIAGLIGPLALSVPAGFVVHWLVDGAWGLHSFQWLAGHGLGTIISMPIAIIFARSKPQDADLRAKLFRNDVVALVAALALISMVSFYQEVVPLLFLPLIALAVLTFRVDRAGAAVGSIAVAVVAITANFLPHNAFAGLDLGPVARSLYVQFYLATLSIVTVPLAVILYQRDGLLGQVRRREALYRVISEYSDDVFLTLDAEQNITFYSSSDLFSEREGQGKPGNIRTAFPQEFFQPIQIALNEAAAAHGHTVMREIRIDEGLETRWLEFRVCSIREEREAEISYVVSLRDTTKTKLEQISATELAHTDSLTQLPNRRAFMRAIKPSLLQKKPLSVAIIDFDHFKSINDTFGHAVGDRVLARSADVLKKYHTDRRFFARLGGEEFGVIFEGGDQQHVFHFCEWLREEISNLVFYDDEAQSFSTTVTIGLAASWDDASPTDVLRKADEALYRGKRNGRDTVVCQGLMIDSSGFAKAG